MPQFTAAVKAQVISTIEAIEPAPEVNPLQAQVDALTDTVNTLIAERDGLVARINAAQAALAALVDALA